MATKLSLYNGALLECGERELASLAENREPRRLLDRAWDTGAVDFCLGDGQWKFAKRTVALAPSTSVVPAFGYRNAFPHPDDMVRTAGVYSDEYLQSPLTAYSSEGAYWYSDTSPMYVSYISNGVEYGGDLSRWPADFVRVVELYLASRIVKKLTQSVDDEKFMLAKYDNYVKAAAGSDAMEGPTTFPPAGSWVRARRGSSSRDGGSRGGLTG